eukprot:TRINITY_DN12428_c0_g1_i1.p1 TRINITY_DN12428_c0_g1~~TRINITY_DN12428_c0_g1_i1.p1  ORF type:complete len:232 (+),score=89.10 TRINITY_DN12428_c0_g1_i1:71-766(+)
MAAQYVAAYSSSFYIFTLTAYMSCYAWGVGYERAPDYLKYRKPVLFADNAFMRWDDMYLPVMLTGVFVTSNYIDAVRAAAQLTLLYFPASRALGSAFATVLYFAGGLMSGATWKLQSNLNPKKNGNINDRNCVASGALCGLAGALLAVPKTSAFKTFRFPVLPIALGTLGERAYNEYARPFTEEEIKSPSVRQWGGMGGAIFGFIMAYTAVRRRSGHVMKNTFQKNLRKKV